MAVSVVNGYATAADLASYMTVNAVTYHDDLAHALTTAARQVDSFCGRRFWLDTTDSSRLYFSRDPRIQIIDDLAVLTTVKVAGNDDGVFNLTYVAGTDFNGEPLNGSADGIDGLPVSRLRFYKSVLPVRASTPVVKVTGRWGWAAVREPIRQASLIMAAEIFKLREAPFGVAGFGEMGPVRIGRMSPQAVALMRPFRTGDNIFGAA